MIQTIKFKDKVYPQLQAEGFAAKFAFPFALRVCDGVGFDIGCMHKEWALPGSIPIDINFADEWEAMKLPDFMVDFIFSSHCLEHLDSWVAALNYWTTRIKTGGTLFLYLPSYSQEYWRPWNNRKHRHVLCPHVISDYLNANGYKNVFASGVDLNASFMVMAEKT